MCHLAILTGDRPGAADDPQIEVFTFGIDPRPLFANEDMFFSVAANRFIQSVSVRGYREARQPT